MANDNLFKFNNTYTTLPASFYKKVFPAKINQPTLLQWNNDLANQLDISTSSTSDEDLAQIFSGQQILPSSTPIATAYAGHQFGHFVPQLGDGRSILLGEVVDSKNQRFDIQLKGSGETPYSRNGDGKAALGPVLREYIVSEALFYLGVPTTRALAAVSTGELVYRDRPLPGAILTRVASSHIRIGHFEYFAARGDLDALRSLANYSIARHYPEIKNSGDMYLEFFKNVVSAQASLIAYWMDIGFIHGVMNTDNMTISGETLDFGPCAFMDHFNFNQVFSSIDRNGRYAYGNQAPIAQWNLARLADCLIPLIEDDSNKVVMLFEQELSNFKNIFEDFWIQRMRPKLGLFTTQPEDFELIKKWLEYLQEETLDYTISFRQLANLLNGNIRHTEFKPTEKFVDFKLQWQKRLQQQPQTPTVVLLKMNNVNPIYIARNHQVERAIQSALANDLSVFKELVQVLKNPYSELSGFEIYKNPPRPEECISKTFCGT